MEQLWEVAQGNSPLVATAIHDGHKLRPEVATIIVKPPIYEDKCLRSVVVQIERATS